MLGGVVYQLEWHPGLILVPVPGSFWTKADKRSKHRQRVTLAGGVGIALASRAIAHQHAQAQLRPDFMVQVYLRGGADGFPLLAPYLEEDYQANRAETQLYETGFGPTTAQDVIPLAGSLGGTLVGIPKALAEQGQIYTDG